MGEYAIKHHGHVLNTYDRLRCHLDGYVNTVALVMRNTLSKLNKSLCVVGNRLHVHHSVVHDIALLCKQCYLTLTPTKLPASKTTLSLLARRSGKRGPQLRGNAKVRAPVAIPVDLVNHGIPIPIASPRTIRRSMIHIPNLGAIRALEKPIMPGAIIPIRAGEMGSGLLPARGQTRIAGSVPRQQAETVRCRPAVGGRVS